MADTQSRKYQLTLNNPLDKQLDHDTIKAKLAQLTAMPANLCCASTSSAAAL